MTARSWLSQATPPADPVLAAQATTKQYADMASMYEGVTPGTVLNIGPDQLSRRGLNHFSVQVARDGDSAITTKSSLDIAAGYMESPYYVVAGTAERPTVQMRASVGGPITSGTTYARCEHREQDASGVDYTFDPFAVGTHRLHGRTKITHLPPSKPEIVYAQLHNGAADRVALRTQVISAATKNLARINGSAVTPRFSEGYVTGTEFEWMIEVVGTGAATCTVNIYYNDMITPFITSTALASTGSASWYFKTGCYLQSDTTTDIATEYGAVELRDLWHSHSSWTTPKAFYPPLSAGDQRVTAGVPPLSRWGLLGATMQPFLGGVLTTYGVAASSVWWAHRCLVPAGTPITAVAVAVGTAGAGAAATGQNGLGVYEINQSTGVANLVSSTTTDAALFTSAGWRTKTLSAPIAAQATDREVLLAGMVALATTAPKLATQSVGASSALMGTRADTGVRTSLGFYAAATTAWPATVTLSSAGMDSSLVLAGFY